MKLSRLVAIAALLLPVAHAAAAPQKIMVFDFFLDNTSMEPTTAAEKARIARISDALRSALQKSGKYDVIAAKVEQRSSVPQVGKCNDEELATAQKAGAELAACPWVQKVSNLILNLNIVIETAKTEQAVLGGSVDIRGNTDQSWDHGLRFLFKEHVFSKN